MSVGDEKMVECYNFQELENGSGKNCCLKM